MTDSGLNNDQGSKLADWAEKQRQKAQVDSQANVPIDGQTAAPNPPEVQSTPVVEDVPKEQTPPKVEEPVAEPVAAAPKSWDDPDDNDTVQTQATVSSTIDFSKIGSAFGWQGIKDESEFNAKATELNTKLKSLEEAPLQGVPEDFREVLDVAKKSGDWKGFLSEQLVDWRTVDPIRLYEDESFRLAQADPRYQNADGKFSEQTWRDELDAIPYNVKKMYGVQLQQSFINDQARAKQAIVAKAQARIADAENSLAKATKSINEALPFEQYGIKFEPKHSAEMYDGITSSKLTKQHLGTSYEKLIEAGVDMSKLNKVMTLAQYGEKMIKFKSQNAKTAAKTEILEKTQNVRLDNPGTTVNPVQQQKPLTIAEKTAAYMAEQGKSVFDKKK